MLTPRDDATALRTRRGPATLQTRNVNTFDATPFESITCTLLSPALRPSCFAVPLRTTLVSDRLALRRVRSEPLTSTRGEEPNLVPPMVSVLLPSKRAEATTGPVGLGTSATLS